MCPHPLLLFFIVKIRVSFILLTMISFMNGLIKHIKINCYFIRYHLGHGALKLFSVPPLKINLQISSPSHILMVRLRALVDNLKLVSHPPWVWGGLITWEIQYIHLVFLTLYKNEKKEVKVYSNSTLKRTNSRVPRGHLLVWKWI